MIDCHEDDKEADEAAADISLLNAGCIAQSHCGHAQHNEGEDERIAEGQPVRHLSAVPEHIDRTDQHAEEHYDTEECIADLLLRRNTLVEEEQRHTECCHDTAVNLRLTLNIDRAVLVDTGELCNEIQHVELRLEGPVRLCEIEFTECQRIVDRQDHEHCTAHCNGSRERHADDDVDNVLAVLLIELDLVRAEEEIEGNVFTTKNKSSSKKKWYYVQYGSKTGYIRSDMLKSVNYQSESGRATDDLNYRAGAGTKMKRKGTIYGLH